MPVVEVVEHKLDVSEEGGLATEHLRRVGAELLELVESGRQGGDGGP